MIMDMIKVFERQLSGVGKTGDVFIGLTTSGKSENLINAFKVAHEVMIYQLLAYVVRWAFKILNQI